MALWLADAKRRLFALETAQRDSVYESFCIPSLFVSDIAITATLHYIPVFASVNCGAALLPVLGGVIIRGRPP
jgi:hypothetical protein